LPSGRGNGARFPDDQEAAVASFISSRSGVWAGAVVIAGLLLALGMALGGCEDDVTDLDHLDDAGQN
jgi:phosphate/sulfate permease